MQGKDMAAFAVGKMCIWYSIWVNILTSRRVVATVGANKSRHYA